LRDYALGFPAERGLHKAVAKAYQRELHALVVEIGKGLQETGGAA